MEVKEILLTKGERALVNIEDYDYLMQWKWSLGTHGYAVRSQKRHELNGEKRRNIFMHRVILSRTLNRTLLKDELTDHINHGVRDNRRNNLRLATLSENMRNRLMAHNTKSGYKGVVLKKGRWVAYIKYLGVCRTIGSYDTKEEAAIAYNVMAKELWGEFAHLNVIKRVDADIDIPLNWGKTKIPVGIFSIHRDSLDETLNIIRSGKSSFEPVYVVKKKTDNVIEDVELLEFRLVSHNTKGQK